MTETATRTREIGRPRTFSDEAIYAATATVLAKMGNEHLSLSLIADEVGCSPPALVQRFGSKRALLLNYVAWITEQIRLRFAAVGETNAAPLDKIKGLASLPRSKRPYEITEQEGMPTSVFMHLAAWNDDSFRPLVEERLELLENEFHKLLVQATEAGQIRGCDEREMARALVTTFSGIALQALSVSRGPVEERAGHMVDFLLKPYRVDA